MTNKDLMAVDIDNARSKDLITILNYILANAGKYGNDGNRADDLYCAFEPELSNFLNEAQALIDRVDVSNDHLEIDQPVIESLKDINYFFNDTLAIIEEHQQSNND